MKRRSVLKAAAGAIGCAMGQTSGLRRIEAAPTGAVAEAMHLTVEMAGLCMFAVDRKATLPSLGTVYGLLPSTAKIPHKLLPHVPMLIVSASDVLSGDPPDEPPTSGELHYLLHGQDVTFVIDGSPAAGPVMCESKIARADKTSRFDATPPYDASWSDIAFIPDLDGMLGGTFGTVLSDYVKPGLSADARVATRVVLAGGTLVGGVPTDSWGRHVAWGLQNAGPSVKYRQSMTDLVEFHLTQGQKIQIQLTGRGAGGKVRTITMNQGAVKAKIHNMMTDPLCNEKGDCGEHHFFAYYALLKSDPPHYPMIGGSEMYLPGTDAIIYKSDPPIYCPPLRGYYE